MKEIRNAKTRTPTLFSSFLLSWKCLAGILFLASSFDCTFYNYRFSLYCQALSSKSTSSTPSTKLTSVGESKFAVLDGAEWNSVKCILQKQHTPRSSSSTPQSTKYGYMNVITGNDEDNRRIVAMQCIDNDNVKQKASAVVYKDSVAAIPNKVSDSDAISTYIASLSAIVCALPRLENIGGDGDESFTLAGKAVVLGSGDLACFSAEGLASLGMDVSLVNNRGNANIRQNVGKLRTIKPAMGESEIGFASYLGEFDSLVDTIGNERTSSGAFGEDDDENIISLGDSTLKMLESQHKCFNYVSTLTKSQTIVTTEGLFGGPGKADGYSETISNPSSIKNSRESQSIIPPRGMGATIEALMENDVLYTEKQRSKACSKKSDIVRGWSLSDFWEQISWPRDSSGTGGTRFGLPVRDLDEIDEESEFFVSERSYDKDNTDDDAEDNVKNRAKQNNPYVLDIMDINGFQSEIVDTEKNCIMFMSARFCKTCKTINPAYNRMARINQENGNASNYSFVKAETSGAPGKALAKHVSVRAVPSFVYVREGKVLGQTYVSRLPSPKVDKAIQLLASGEEWDYSLVDDE